MSTDDSNPHPSGAEKRTGKPSAGRASDSPLPPTPAEKAEEPPEDDLGRSVLSPALRLMAWMIAGVLLLAILAWTLSPGP